MATYYVDGAVGDDANDGLSEGASGAKLTIDAAVSLATTAGDIVYVKASATYGEVVTLDASGTTSAPIGVVGYTSTVGDGGRFVLDGTDTLTDGFFGSNRSYWYFHNMEVKNFTDNGFDQSAADGMRFVNCSIHDNGDRGIYVDNWTQIDRCEIYNNSVAGVWADQYCNITNSLIYDNGGSYQVRCSGYSWYISRSVIAGASTYLVYLPWAGSFEHVTFDGKNTAHGIHCTSAFYPMTIQNCIFHDCNTAINMPAGAYRSNQAGGANMFSSNTTDYANWTATDDDFTGTPAFTDEAGGDYTLGPTSDAIGAARGLGGAGSSNLDVGAYQTAAAAGGGRIVYAG